MLDRWLAPRAPEPDPAYTELRALLEVMAAGRALVRVADVAGRAGVGVRSLQPLFAGYVGVSPTAALARYRLQDAAAAIDRGEGRRPLRAGDRPAPFPPPGQRVGAGPGDVSG